VLCTRKYGTLAKVGTLHRSAQERFTHVRADLVANGASFHAWCRSQGIQHQNARKALFWQWTGDKASLLADRTLEEAGMEQQC
jgi:hypothetical protein